MIIELKLLLLAIPIDIICLYIQMKWGMDPNTAIRNITITIISGLIIFFTLCDPWHDLYIMNTTDPYGVSSNLQLGMIAIAVCPGLIVTTIWTYIECELIFRKYNKQTKKRKH